MEEKMNGSSGGLVPWKHPNQPTRYEVIADHALGHVCDAGPRQRGRHNRTGGVASQTTPHIGFNQTLAVEESPAIVGRPGPVGVPQALMVDEIVWMLGYPTLAQILG
jgi:hypothetical protein